ncbi:MAG: 4-hydroxythreonine-4-phosphate dehydrogenase PdxA [Candidatus Dormibacteraeota bacterium]|nr:4-hydroxythreonine-4-phosphate dehydrogenase PdxA [Candidatus Dormibacteraeota bacterium]
MARSTIAVTMGDPAGVGPEIVLAALAAEPHRAVVVGDAARLKLAGQILPRGGPRLRSINTPSEAHFEPGLVNVIDLANVPAELPWGRLSEVAGAASFSYLERATQLALAGEVAAICTAPINKEAWRAAGIEHPGHTEALAALCGSGTYAMMLVNRRLRVVHQSTHASLAAAVGKATTQRCLDCITLASGFLREHGGISAPRIAVAGINPHAGENGLLGSEDREHLLPAVEHAREAGIAASGPWSPDTIFLRGSEGEFDAVVAAYHDQGHIPIKMLGLDSGVNVTIGLPIVRTSVDHGTAFDIAGTGRARPANLLAALRLAEELAGNF